MMALVSAEEKKDFTKLRRIGSFGEAETLKSILFKIRLFLMRCTIYKESNFYMDIRQVTETIAMIEEQHFDIRTITMWDFSFRLY